MATKDVLDRVTDLTADDVLKAVGLRRASAGGDMLQYIGLFAAGVVVGGAAALLLAPKSGSKLRTDISDGIGELKDRAMSRAKEVGDQLRERANGGAERVQE